MFSWATQQLEILAQTVAPPPTDAPSRFVYCVQRNDEASAQSCLAEMDPLGTLVQPTKGSYPLHLACQYNLTSMIQQLMNIPGANIQVTDFAGNTSLHYACLAESKASIDTVRLLVTQFGASVVAKNSQGQTPYDVALVNTVRQYLLPLQLQQETRNALENGGLGLPPGIDLGGLQIRNSALPPPPIGGMGGPPPPLTTPSHTAPISHPTAPPPAPTSGPHTYSRTGHSSAAIFSNKYKSDGFHSSSSDVNLQIKYGHSNSGNVVSTVPPPPSSGNMNSASAPPSVGYPGVANPYAAFGTGAMKTRYPVYNTTGTPGMPQPPAPMSGGYHFGAGPAQVSTNLTTFNPAGNGISTQPGSGFQQHQPALTPQQPAANLPTSTFFPPPPLSSMSQPQPQPQQQFVYTQHSYPQQLQDLPPQTSLPQPIAMTVTSPVSNNQGGAQQVMSSQNQQPSGNPSPLRTKAKAQYQQPPGSGNAHQLFSAQPAPSSGNSQHLFKTLSAPVSGNAQDIFGSPAPHMEQPKDISINYSSQPNMTIPQHIEQSMSTVTNKSANEWFASQSAEKAPLAANHHSTNGFGTPEQPKQDPASMFATPIPQMKSVTMIGVQDSISPCAPTTEEIVSPSTEPPADAASFFGTPPSTVSAIILSGDEAKVQEVATTMDSDDMMMDIPLSPNDPHVLRSESSQQRVTVPVTANTVVTQFDFIGMPPPPFSSTQ